LSVDLKNFLSRSSDLILAVFIVVIMLMIILPVPPEIIDVGITINLTAGIGLLMISLYIPNALQLSTFPSMLLVTTLFRLGVEIATTRQVLLHAYAGEIIHAFGQFVVGGNYIVGFIVFLIITIVQFIVVTKGAERVAEVAARFRFEREIGFVCEQFDDGLAGFDGFARLLEPPADCCRFEIFCCLGDFQQFHFITSNELEQKTNESVHRFYFTDGARRINAYWGRTHHSQRKMRRIHR